ncbi:hypothetical protein V6N11_000045 [Hibiscus sabdariffa]|uniref:Uncharacterized protein n=1 Tax=Hibiscus sabdariffa TaxID=183260 RepID=A0ABR2NNR6_9ROSI
MVKAQPYFLTTTQREHWTGCTSLGDSNPRPSSDARSQDQALTTTPKAIANGEGATLFLNHYAARALDRMVLVQTSSLGAAPPH